MINCYKNQKKNVGFHGKIFRKAMCWTTSNPWNQSPLNFWWFTLSIGGYSDIFMGISWGDIMGWYLMMMLIVIVFWWIWIELPSVIKHCWTMNRISFGDLNIFFLWTLPCIDVFSWEIPKRAIVKEKFTSYMLCILQQSMRTFALTSPSVVPVHHGWNYGEMQRGTAEKYIRTQCNKKIGLVPFNPTKIEKLCVVPIMIQNSQSTLTWFQGHG